MIVAEFDDHLPFYGQADIYWRQRIELDRGTLGNWVGRACFHLQPVVVQMREALRSADRISAAERGHWATSRLDRPPSEAGSPGS